MVRCTEGEGKFRVQSKEAIKEGGHLNQKSREKPIGT